MHSFISKMGVKDPSRAKVFPHPACTLIGGTSCDDGTFLSTAKRKTPQNRSVSQASLFVSCLGADLDNLDRSPRSKTISTSFWTKEMPTYGLFANDTIRVTGEETAGLAGRARIEPWANWLLRWSVRNRRGGAGTRCAWGWNCANAAQAGECLRRARGHGGTWMHHEARLDRFRPIRSALSEGLKGPR